MYVNLSCLKLWGALIERVVIVDVKVKAECLENKELALPFSCTLIRTRIIYIWRTEQFVSLGWARVQF